MKMAAEKVEALLVFTEIDHTGLVRMQLQTKITQDGGRPPLDVSTPSTMSNTNHTR
jgi:hypothetical protein